MTNISNQQLQAYYENLRRNQVYRAYAANYAKKEEPVEMVTLTIKKDIQTYNSGVPRTDRIFVNNDEIPQGEITRIGTITITTLNFVKGTSVTLRAEPTYTDYGYKFNEWKGYPYGQNEITVIMESNKEMTATFTSMI